MTRLEEDRLAYLGLLAAATAHDLATPLGTMAVVLGDWRRDAQFLADPARAADIAAMTTAVAQGRTLLSELIDALLDRPHAPTAASALLRRVANEWQGSHPATPLRLDDGIAPAGRLPDDPALRHALRALLDNAAEASPAGVALGAERDGARLVVTVRDGGPGFPATLLDGARPHVHGSPKPGGHGVGLVLAEAAVRRLGGTLALVNPPCGGAEARIGLPLLPTDAAVPA